MKTNYRNTLTPAEKMKTEKLFSLFDNAAIFVAVSFVAVLSSYALWPEESLNKGVSFSEAVLTQSVIAPWMAKAK